MVGVVVLTAVLWRANGSALDLALDLGTRVSPRAVEGLRAATVWR